MSVVEGYIQARNLAACLDLLAGVGETELDGGVLAAFETGLKGTSPDRDRWTVHALGRLTAEAARVNIGAGLIAFRVEAPHGYTRAVSAVLRACGEYFLEAQAALAEAGPPQPGTDA
ncbi:hypothetical protein [uncultured Deinococcus sp.]|uniref:hypothetical protein n=1 Tax=uncultured Deinococcus sp. TaxID=158789 RepID=UPI00258DC737|nr:hypothetical protein [uncultured Deinococcus sp.]